MYHSPAYKIVQLNYETPCWIWQRCKNAAGYGVIRICYVLHRAHVYYYEKYKGSVPDDLELDHLCRNRACVNPEHLEAVTSQINVQRGYDSRRRGQ